jgi:hypothetical protein
MIDPNDFSTSSETNDTNDTSPGDGSINRADVSTVNLEFDLSLDSALNSIGVQQTYPMLSNEFDDMYDMDDIYHQPTSLRSIPPAAEITQHARGDLDLSFQSTGPPYQFNNSLLVPRAGPADLGLPAFNIDFVEILLSKLHLELCNQLFYVRSAPRDVRDALRLTMSPESSGSHDGEIGKERPLVPVTRASRELERLLASLRPSTRAAEHTPLTIPDHSRLPSLRTTQLLVALSCYIQIISVYDSIFTTVTEYLASGGPPTPVTSVSSSHHQTSTHTPYLGGLPVPTDWKLCETLLAHQIEYQLERIEILIGLPEQYRVSSKPGDDGKDMVSGLFAGQQSQFLLNAVFQLADLRPGEPHTRGVRSLKLRMRQMKDL